MDFKIIRWQKYKKNGCRNESTSVLLIRLICEICRYFTSSKVTSADCQHIGNVWYKFGTKTATFLPKSAVPNLKERIKMRGEITNFSFTLPRPYVLFWAAKC